MPLNVGKAVSWLGPGKTQTSLLRYRGLLYLKFSDSLPETHLWSRDDACSLIGICKMMDHWLMIVKA